MIPWNGTSGDSFLLFLNKKTFILLNYLQKNQNYRSAISICKGKTLSANFYFKNTLKQCCHTATLTISRFFCINQIIYFSFYPCLRKVCTEKKLVKTKQSYYHVRNFTISFLFIIQIPYARHYNPLLIRNCSWILTIHKAKDHST